MFSIENQKGKTYKILKRKLQVIKKKKIISVSSEILGKCAGRSLVSARPLCSVDDAIDGVLRSSFSPGSEDSLREEDLRILTS